MLLIRNEALNGLNRTLVLRLECETALRSIMILPHKQGPGPGPGSTLHAIPQTHAHPVSMGCKSIGVWWRHAARAGQRSRSGAQVRVVRVSHSSAAAIQGQGAAGARPRPDPAPLLRLSPVPAEAVPPRRRRARRRGGRQRVGAARPAAILTSASHPRRRSRPRRFPNSRPRRPPVRGGSACRRRLHSARRVQRPPARVRAHGEDMRHKRRTTQRCVRAARAGTAIRVIVRISHRQSTRMHRRPKRSG